MKRLCNRLPAGAVLGAFVLLFPARESAQAQEKVVYTFCPNQSCTGGRYPQGDLINVNGTFYGTTVEGGTSNGGTVFSFDLETGTETALYSFCSQYPYCLDGESPIAGVIDVDGTLYGTTSLGGGVYGPGTVFSLDPTTGTETVLHAFCHDCTDGENPYAGLIDVNGTLYGTTKGGGANGHGTVFAVDTGTGAETVSYSFCSQTNCTDGKQPEAGLIALNGLLYGTTQYGGTSTTCLGAGCGTLYSLDPSSGVETALHSFGEGTDGKNPTGGLVAARGKLYGTTLNGGTATTCTDGCGTLYSFDPTTGQEKTLYSFSGGSDGQNPGTDLIEAGGTLYGATRNGGAKGEGTVFSFDLTTGTETVLYTFCQIDGAQCRDGKQPEGGLVKLKGRLYGTTYSGGYVAGVGVIFRVKKP